MSIVIKNAKVVDFYTKHALLDVESVNIWMVDMFEKMMDASSQGTAQGMMSKMEGFFSQQLGEIESLKKEINVQNATREFLQSSVQQINGSMGSMRDDFKNLIVTQFAESQKDGERMIRSALDGAVKDSKEKDAIVTVLNEKRMRSLESLLRIFRPPFQV